MLDQDALMDQITQVWMPVFIEERRKLDRIDNWYRWEHDKPHTPLTQPTREYVQLVERAQTPWLTLVVTSVAQSLYVEGYHGTEPSPDPDKATEPPDPAGNAGPWRYWQANGFDRRQIALHRAALAYGISYETVLPGTDFTGNPIPVMRGVSPRKMIAFYDEPAEDDWPEYALRVDPMRINGQLGSRLRVYDDEFVYELTGDPTGGNLVYVGETAHAIGVCPVVRFANMLDLDGRSAGEVEPFIPVAGRIDQTVFDRLVVQRFASWIVRTIAGMAPPDDLQGETEMEYRRRIAKRLQVEDILIAEDSETKFGSLPATPLDGFVAAKDADTRDLAAVSQTPPHYLLGEMANLSADAITAAEGSLTRKVVERQHSFGESHEQALRLGAYIMGDTDGAMDVESEVRWRDMESRSLAQAADALGKIATMLNVPVELLWEQIPGWTDATVQRAKDLMNGQDGIANLLQQLVDSTPPKPNPTPSMNGG